MQVAEAVLVDFLFQNRVSLLKLGGTSASRLIPARFLLSYSGDGLVLTVVASEVCIVRLLYSYALERL